MYSLKDYISGLKDFLLNSTEKILITNFDGKIVLINDSFLIESGLKRSDKLHLNQLIETSGRTKIDSEIRKKNICISKIEFTFASGKKKLPIFVFNIRNSTNDIGRVLIITDGPQENEELRNNLFQKSILEAMNTRNDAVWFVSNIQTGKNTFTSTSAKNIFGWDSECFKSGGWFFFFSIVHLDDMENIFTRHMEWVLMKNKLGLLYDHVEFSNTFRIRNSKNEFIPIETEANVLEWDELGKIKTIFGSYRPIDLKTMEARIAEQSSTAIKIIDGKTYVELDYLKQLREQRTENAPKHVFKNLSSREFEILELIIDEFSSGEIAKQLNISIHTVNLHRKQIMKKLEAKNLAGLMRIYYTAL